MISLPEILVVGGLLSVFPLGWIQSRYISDARTKHTFSLVFGFIIGFVLFGYSILHTFFSSAVAYAVIVYYKKRCDVIIFIWAMAYLSGAHIYRQYVDYMGWSLDFSLAQMIVTLKLIAISFNIHDAIKDESKLTPEEKKTVVRRTPSPLEFFSYIFYFGNFIAGPFFDYKSYSDYIHTDTAGFYRAKLNNQKPPAGTEHLNTWNSRMPLVCLGKALLCAAVYGIGSIFLPMSFVITSDFLDGYPMWKKFVYLYFALMCLRCKYYFGWILAEGGLLMGYFGYNGVDAKTGKAKWDKCKNIEPYKVEFAQNLREVAAVWNVLVAYWLKHYVNNRVKKVFKNPVAPLIVTYAVSAFWHGFYPAYYLFFFSFFFLGYAANDFRKTFRPYVVDVQVTVNKDTGKEERKEIPKYPLKTYYDIFSWVVTILAVAYLTTVFTLLAFSNSIAFWKSVYFVGHLSAAAVIALCRLMPRKRTAKKPTAATTPATTQPTSVPAPPAATTTTTKAE